MDRIKWQNELKRTAIELSDMPFSKSAASHFKKRIWVQDQGGAGFETGGILAYVEDLKPGSNKNIGPKDFFEMACNISFIIYRN